MLFRSPSTAILDYELLVSLPKHVIAFSGCDALAHALEAGISVLASDMVRMQSVQAAVQIIKQLEASCNGDLNARRDIHLSATIAGACINNSITCLLYTSALKCKSAIDSVEWMVLRFCYCIAYLYLY